MNARTKTIVIGATLFAALLALLWAAGSVTAQPPTQGPGGDVPGPTVPTWIHVQGRLYFHGNPVADGPHDNVRFRLYTTADPAVTTPVWEATQTVTTTNGGLFSTYLDVNQATFNGQALWLGIKVALDSEMTPRRPILPVPYALGLAPGAIISATSDAAPILRTINSGTYPALSGYSSGGTGIYGRTDVQDPTKAAIYGYASEHAAGVYGESVLGDGVHGKTNGNQAGVYGDGGQTGEGVHGESYYGVGVYGRSSTNAALYADGPIQSSARSYIWISGNDLVMGEYTIGTDVPTLAPENGAAKVSTLGYNIVVSTYLPIHVPGVLYGQDVKLKSVRVFYQWNTGGDNVINRTQLTRLSGAGVWESLVNDVTTHGGTTSTYYDLVIPAGSQSLSSASGPLGLLIRIRFATGPSAVWIHGVRLELEHN